MSKKDQPPINDNGESKEPVKNYEGLKKYEKLDPTIEPKKLWRNKEINKKTEEFLGKDIKEVKEEIEKNYPEEQKSENTSIETKEIKPLVDKKPENKSFLKRIGNLFKGKGKNLIMGTAFLAASTIAVGQKTENNQINDSIKNKTEQTTNSQEKVTDQLRTDWNNYVDWLEAQGLRGNEKLDHNDLSGKMIDKYREELKEKGQSTLVSRESIENIQEEFVKYRNWSLERIHKGEAAFDKNTNDKNYMESLSIVDNIAGQRTTTFKFPEEYMVYKENQLTKKTDEGFAKISSNTVQYHGSVADTK